MRVSYLLGLVCAAFCWTLPAAAVGEDRFKDLIRPALVAHCVQCHGPDLAEGQLRIDQLTANLSERENAARWLEVRNAINLGEMPPQGEPPLKSLEFTKFFSIILK